MATPIILAVVFVVLALSLVRADLLDVQLGEMTEGSKAKPVLLLTSATFYQQIKSVVIVDPLSGRHDNIPVKTPISMDYPRQLVGKAIYYFNRESGVLERLDHTGTVRKLNFINSSGFLVSPDEQNVVWRPWERRDDGCRIFLAKIDGRGQKQIYEKQAEKLYESDLYLVTPKKWTNNGHIYFSFTGDHGSFDCDWPVLISVGVADKKVSRFQFGEDVCFRDVAMDGRLSSTLSRSKDGLPFIVKNIADGTEVVVGIQPFVDKDLNRAPLEPNQSFFSPSGTRVIYNVDAVKANGKNKIICVGVDGKNSQVVLEDSKSFTLDGWVSEDKIVVHDLENAYVVDVNSLKKTKL